MGALHEGSTGGHILQPRGRPDGLALRVDGQQALDLTCDNYSPSPK